MQLLSYHKVAFVQQVINILNLMQQSRSSR